MIPWSSPAVICASKVILFLFLREKKNTFIKNRDLFRVSIATIGFINILFSSIAKWMWKILRRIIVVNLAPFWQRPYLCIYPLVCVKREGVDALAVGHGVGEYTYTSSGFGDGCWISSNGYRKSAIGGGLHRPSRGCNFSAMALCYKCMKRIVWQREQGLYREEGYVEGRQK